MADPYILWARFTEPNLGRVEWVKSRLDMCQISKIGSSFPIRRWEPPWFPPWRGPIISQASGASWSIFGGSTMFSFVDIFYLWIYQWCVVSWFNIRCAHHLFDHWVAQLCLHQTMALPCFRHWMTPPWFQYLWSSPPWYHHSTHQWNIEPFKWKFLIKALLSKRQIKENILINEKDLPSGHVLFLPHHIKFSHNSKK